MSNTSLSNEEMVLLTIITGLYEIGDEKSMDWDQIAGILNKPVHVCQSLYVRLLVEYKQMIANDPKVWTEKQQKIARIIKVRVNDDAGKTADEMGYAGTSMRPTIDTSPLPECLEPQPGTSQDAAPKSTPVKGPARAGVKRPAARNYIWNILEEWYEDIHRMPMTCRFALITKISELIEKAKKANPE